MPVTPDLAPVPRSTAMTLARLIELPAPAGAA
jgi:hypothetical protein